MTVSDKGEKAGLLLQLGRRLKRRAEALAVVLTALASLLLALSIVWIWFLIPGGLAALALVGIQLGQSAWREELERTNATAAEKRLQDAITQVKAITIQLSADHGKLADTFAEITERAAALRGLPIAQRRAVANELLQQTVDAIVWVVHRNVEGVRAVVYIVDRSGTGLSPARWQSNGSRRVPTPFVTGTARFTKALAMIHGRQSLFVDDIANAPRRKWAGSGNGYNTFISCTIASVTTEYGMLTVDAPRMDDLTEDDTNDLRLIAGILAGIFSTL